MPAIRIRAIKAHMEVTGISGAESKSAMGALSNRYARNSIHSTTRIAPFRLVGGKENVQKERTVPISRASIISDWIHAAKV